jgi:hypothetical protein
MELTREQIEVVSRGKAVPLTVAGQECVLIRRDFYERLVEEEYDSGPWTVEEMDLLASQTADLLARDGFDTPEDA